MLGLLMSQFIRPFAESSKLEKHMIRPFFSCSLLRQVIKKDSTIIGRKE
jgi:hypothetical protein